MLIASIIKGYNGITVTFVRPDGTKDTFMPIDETGQYVAGETQSLGAIYFYYAPNMVGNWSVSFTMPAQNITDIQETVQLAGAQAVQRTLQFSLIRFWRVCLMVIHGLSCRTQMSTGATQ